VWNLTAADGSIAGTDFFAMLAQFGHSCAYRDIDLTRQHSRC
jgi:hypothetical protein